MPNSKQENTELYIAFFKFFLTNGTASGTFHAHEIRKIIAEF